MAITKPTASIRERIETALIIRNMKPIDLANATGIPKASISHYLKGKVNPKQDRIFLMAKAFSCDEAWLMGYDVPMAKATPTEKAKQDFEIVSKFNKLTERDKSIVLSMIDNMIGGYEK